ncbi:calcium-binding protein [Rhodobacter maris]|uniref:Hemolysin type calcium-binding protein n=1 Tax=Rhodobacter maris TaxID=446682 RepID=A0A285SET3_9RHOB|nr:calcium-binding protein [Rhodobacter maris]SOC06432.1 hemolysin type calcium-binding protein [Rhodobacter maris]
MVQKITLSGFSFTELGGNGEDITTPVATTLEIIATDNVTFTSSYTYVGEDDIVGDLTNSSGTVYDVVLNGISIMDNDAYEEATLLSLTSGGVTYQIMVIGYEDPDTNDWTNYVFYLTDTEIGGTTVPTSAELLNLLSTMTRSTITSGTYAEGASWDPAEVAAVTSIDTDIYDATSGDDSITGYSFDDTINGLAGDDTIDGGDGDDSIDGAGGNDILYGSDGNDTLIGNNGSDELYGGDGDDLLMPGANSDYDLVVASSGNDTIDFDGASSTGDYTLDYSDQYDGTTGIQVSINASASGDGTNVVFKADGSQDSLVNLMEATTSEGLTIVGTSQGDIFNVTTTSGEWVGLIGGGGGDYYGLDIGADSKVRLNFASTATEGVVANIADGYIANDGTGGSADIDFSGEGTLEIRTGNYADSLVGSDGNESFIVQGGNDTVDGGDGFDLIRYDRDGYSSVSVDLASGTATTVFNGTTYTDSLTSIESVRGSTGDDVISGSSANEQLDGREGDDTLTGGAGNDTIIGGDGTDTAVLNVASSAVTVTVSSGVVTITGEGTDTYTGIEYYQFTDGTLTAAEVAALVGETVGEVVIGTGDDDTIEGGSGDDTISGGAGDDSLLGGDGDDVISSSDGDDSADGESGNDSIGGGTGNDTLIGGSGNDTIGGGQDDDSISGAGGNDAVSGGQGNDWIDGGDGNDSIGGGFGNDTIFGAAGDDSLGGGTGRDVIDGGTGADAIGGGEGDDTITGGDGDDFLAGGGRDDVIEGGDGDDVINGGSGDDTMTGGDGADVFVFNEMVDGDSDVIVDFEDGVDLIRISGIENEPGSGLNGYVAALNITDVTIDGEAGVTMSYGGQTITLLGVSADELTKADFLFA